ncbi:epimerase [Marivirga tractuosa]|uniref:NAD-dependent epimerase/dehydratase n=1 Tax=Marivirga tractuosa (strain ATCC 23168 / DSM 4126 / NBRC 15989 / NCIMB 1408 / VKM B-1430 / H-43) TaxID=643867 RepID=E4TMX7_MARTH|nr:SDR family oxidoreductase [Marivirga tractuosa]ADR21408.1 NAD-dependent epimerase/dehydratase [Marivirga tractuosa DSM 4126]BDD14138.1 epimerase [Marivirga tractuosa]
MKILLTGANGYIGRRLLPVLVMQGHEVICLVRDKRRIELEDKIIDKVQFYEADLLKPEQLQNLPKDIEAAYYLVHSMGSSSKSFQEMEKNTALNFVGAINETTCEHIIYLSGISNDDSLSKHLTSRKNAESILAEANASLTVLRAAIIIGSGGASFEIIRDLVEKLPIMVAPKWLRTRCQPIAIRNVINYLSGIIGKEESFGKTYDIGGPDILTYKEMLLIFAQVRGLKRYIITLPVLTPRLSSYWLHFVTATSYKIASSLVDSMKNEVIVENKGIEDIVPQKLIAYSEAVKMAFDRIAQNEVVSSWKDAFASSKIDTELMEFVKVPTHGCFIDKRTATFERDRSEVLQNIWKIGGDRGWYYWNFLWKIRGYMDKAVGGVGLRRGRRSPDQLVAGDSLDFWRVLIADKKEGRLLLYAEMKLPGEAWLEFKITKENEKNKIIQTATFRPHGLFGRLYWYSVYLFHEFIFKGMMNRIIHHRENEKESVVTT